MARERPAAEAERARSEAIARSCLFPLAPSSPDPVFITRPCGCTFMVADDYVGDDSDPLQVSWCDTDDPGYAP